MLTTDKTACNILADLLIAHGVKDVVLSPGSRNAPVIVALTRRPELRCITVIDERVAAFTALGLAIESDRGTVLVCTSGTALLNYAPAIAEAFYRKVPLIVVSADRPMQWIDQDDSQTMRQPGTLATVVKQTYDIPADIESTADGKWMANRLINDALITALGGRKAPVHINLRLDAPLSNDAAEYTAGTARTIATLTPREDITVKQARDLGGRLASPRRVMIVAGFSRPDERLNRALCRLAELPNVVVLTETVANLHGKRFIGRIDTVLSAMSDNSGDALRPDTVITTGGALVSRHVKEYLRSIDNLDHWHVGLNHTTIDCFRHLTLRIDVEPGIFFQQLAAAMQPHRATSDYASLWRDLACRAAESHDKFLSDVPWSDLRAFDTIIPLIPCRWNVHLSNGTPIRYAQLNDCSHLHRCDCNRGVSGIDGSTSTAIGAAIGYRSAPTLLISGDMSAQYDIGAIFSGHVPENFKMIVIANGGGGIFRFIGATSKLPELDQRLACKVDLPWADICQAVGWRCFTCGSESEIRDAWPDFSNADRPAIMTVTTDGALSADLLRQYFNK